MCDLFLPILSRYNLPEMKHLCESMLTPARRSNWLDLLRAGDRLGSPRLMVSALHFLKSNVVDIIISSEEENTTIPVNTDAAVTATAAVAAGENETQQQPDENDWKSFQQEFPHLYTQLVAGIPFLSSAATTDDGDRNVGINKDIAKIDSASSADFKEERIDTQQIFSAWNRPGPPSALYIQHIEFSDALKRQRNTSLLNSADVQFPYVAVLASLGSMGVYYFLVKNPTLFNGSLIPLFNVIYMAGFIYYLYHSSTREK